ncbi:MAG: HEAT repeat domain-containing protein, partial [Myxococcales bacterium]|nr:HEAT repeat domain-containing protein [Myxococcales bacterium]
VHRDLKPENIFLLEHDGKGDFVKIVDFGIALLQGAVAVPEQGAAASGFADGAAEAAQAANSSARSGSSASVHTPSLDRSVAPSALSAGERYTLPGTLLGTPLYMSPEQVRAGEIDARADQYALGCILYEMLVGEVPFTAPTVSKLLFKHLTEAPLPPRKRRPDLAILGSLEALILRLLAKDPAARFASMHEVEEALEAELASLQPRQGLRGLRRSTQALIVAPLLLSIAGLGYALLHLTKDKDEGGPPISGAELLALRAQAVSALKTDLTSASPALRRGALQRLGHGGDGIARSDIEPLLQDGQDDVRAQAALALGGLADRQAIPRLQPLLAGAHPVPVRVAAATALDALGDAQGRTFLQHALSHERGDLQLRAAYVLCERGEASALPVLRQHASQTSSADALSLWARLLHCGDPGANETLRAELGTTPDRALRAAGLLAQEGDAQGTAYLRARLQKREADQLSVARLLSVQGDAAALALLRQVIGDRRASAAALRLAAEGLAFFGEREDVRRLGAHFTRAQEAELRQSLAAAIVQIADHEPTALSQRGLLWAQAAITSDDWITRRGAADVLGDSNAPEAVQLLAQLSQDGDARVRRSAVRALGRKREKPALAALAGTLRDSDAQVRKEALFSMEKVAAPLASSGLSSLVNDLSGWLAETLKSGTQEEQLLSSGLLLRLGDQGQRALFSSFLTSTDELLRKLAVQKAPAEAALLNPLVRDAAYGVRFAAAVRLASLFSSPPSAQEKEPLKQVLQEGLAQGGADAISAYASLRKIGANDAEPPGMDAALKGSDIENRLAAVEASALLPPDRALGLLALAAQDHDPRIRQRVAEVVAELPVAATPAASTATASPSPDTASPSSASAASAATAEARSILRRLSQDGDPLVRSRAQVLLSRVLLPRETQALARSAPRAETALPTSRANQGDVRDGGVTVATAPLDAASNAPDLAASAAPPSNTTATENQGTGRSQKGEASAPEQTNGSGKSADAASQLFEKVQQALAKKDTERARKSLAKALAKCAKTSTASPLCAKLAFESTVSLGQTYEAKSFWVDAMQEYEQLVARASVIKLSTDQVATLQAAMTKLKPSLGLIVISKQVGKKCQVIRRWVKTGMTQIDIDGEAQAVEVEAGETKTFGSCR